MNFLIKNPVFDKKPEKGTNRFKICTFYLVSFLPKPQDLPKNQKISHQLEDFSC